MDAIIMIIVCSASVVVGLISGFILSSNVRQASSPAVFKLIRSHFAPTSVTDVSVTERQFPARVRADLHRCLDRYFNETSTVANLSGIRNQDSMMFIMMTSFDLPTKKHRHGTLGLNHFFLIGNLLLALTTFAHAAEKPNIHIILNDDDQAETNNLAEKYPEKVQQLENLWRQRAEEIRNTSLTKQVVNASLHRAVNFFRKQVAINGGYLWRYAADFSEREGEVPASPTTAWVQPPGTPAVGMAYLKAYQLTGDKKLLDAIRETALALVMGQLESGGWDYRIEFDQADRENYCYRTNAVSRPGQASNKKKPRNISTLDDNTTQAALTFLMHADRALDFKDPVIHESTQFALKALLKAQYPNGAWPQRFDGPPDPEKFPVLSASYPEDWSRKYPAAGYLSFYTFNDNAIADTVELMFLAAEIYEDEKYAAAAKRAGDFILLAQMPEPQPGWAQQYNADMHPAWARKFEPPAITGSESQGVMETLLRIYQRTGERKYLEPHPRAIAYFRRSLLDRGQLARFYELRTNRPIFFTKDYNFTYSDTDLPTHYGFKATSRLDAIEAEYLKLVGQNPAEFQPIKILPPQQQPKRTDQLITDVVKLIASQDQRGAWVEPAHYRNRTNIPTGSPSINSRTFATNIITLAKYLAAKRPSSQDRIIQFPGDARHVLCIPAGYQQQKKSIDLLLNFHGHAPHVTASVRIARLNCVVVSVNYGGLSSVYRVPFGKDRKLFATILEQALTMLRAESAFPDDVQWGQVAISSFSAGFGAVREILKTQDYFDRVASIYMVDSLYCGYEGDGTHSVRDGVVHPGLMKDFLRFAQAASRGEKVMIVTHCNGPTPGYASTLETADYLLDKLELKPQSVDLLVEQPSNSEVTKGALRLYRQAAQKGFSLFGSPGGNETDHILHLQHMTHWLPGLSLDMRE